MIISGAIGILIFLTYPVAPPRLMEGYGFVDTVLLHTRAYRVLQPPSMTDLYAAVPSLHVGWNVVMGAALVRESRRASARVFGVAMPLVMAAAVVLTANHYIMDVVAGTTLVVASLVAADRLAARRAAARAAGR
jgi:membrane-associated phospholipid phosphatase